MTQLQATRFTLRPAKIATGDGDGDETGVLVLTGDRIVAVFVRLDAAFYEDAKGSWHLEVGFGQCAGTPTPFRTLFEGLQWIAGRLGFDAKQLADDLAGLDLAFSSPQGGQTTTS